MKKKLFDKNNPDRLPLGKFFAFRLGAFSLAGNYIVIGFLMLYCTNFLKMPAHIVGALLLASKILDAFAELYAGFLIDKTNSKFGKGRPWDLFLIGVWVCTILLFSVPSEASLLVKSIWVFVFYTLVQTVFQTLVQTAATPYTMRAFKNMNVIIKMSSYGAVVGMLLSMALSIAMPILVSTVATSTSGWTRMVLYVSIPLLLLGLTRFLFVKEEYNNENDHINEHVGIKDTIEVLKSNKYIWYVTGIGSVIQIVASMGVGMYYFQYIVGDLTVMSIFSMLSIIVLPIMFLMPKLINKFSVGKIIMIGGMLSIIGGVIAFIAEANLTILMIGAVFMSLGTIAPPYLQGVMVIDCAKYNALQGKKPMEASMAALNQFGSNVGQGLGSYLLGIILSLSGFDGSAVVQSASALLGIRLLFSLIPAAFYILMIISAYKFSGLEKIFTEKDLEIETTI